MMDFQGGDFRHIVVLTGAGISAESGLKTFRDAGGLWEGHDPMEIATPEAFARDPALVYRFYNERRAQLADVEPNIAHQALVRLQASYRGELTLVTQNVDDLHERAGSLEVCHMHGELKRFLCSLCNAKGEAITDYDASTHCSECGKPGGLRPDIVWFGEMPYQMNEIQSALEQCDLFVAIGTSGVVYPAAGFVREALRYGATTVEINKEISEVSSHFEYQIRGPATIQVVQFVDVLLAGFTNT